MSNAPAPRPLSYPWTPRFLYILVTGSILVTAAVCSRSVVVSPMAVVFPLLSGILAAVAWVRFSSRSGQAWFLLLISANISVAGLAMQAAGTASWLLFLLAYALIALYQFFLRASRISLLLISPALFGLLFMNTAALLGDMASGGFPAAFAVLFAFITHATHELELRTPLPEGLDEDPHVHILHRTALAWISIVFFVFGVLSFWPWLGKTYDHTYFWILIIGVLSPLLYLWGRLRQPRRQNSLAALRRFNRLVPYVGLVMLLAIALG